MAILPSLPEVSVSIKVDGQLAQEYEDKHALIEGPLKDKMVLRYIEAKSDAYFIIQMEVSKDYRSGCELKFQAKVDGKSVGYTRYEKADMGKDKLHRHSGELHSVSAGHQILSKFKFSSINIIEDSSKDRIENDIKAVSDIGQIEIAVHRVFWERKLFIFKESSAANELANPVTEIAEKAIKGRELSHGATFGKKVHRTAPTYHHKPIYVDRKDSPIAVFKFCYRSKDALRRLLIIPRTPSPDPFDELSVEERDRLARMSFAALRSGSRSLIKGETTTKDEKRIKRERTLDDGAINLIVDENSQAATKPPKRVKREKIAEVVDLTDD